MKEEEDEEEKSNTKHRRAAREIRGTSRLADGSFGAKISAPKIVEDNRADFRRKNVDLGVLGHDRLETARRGKQTNEQDVRFVDAVLFEHIDGQIDGRTCGCDWVHEKNFSLGYVFGKLGVDD